MMAEVVFHVLALIGIVFVLVFHDLFINKRLDVLEEKLDALIKEVKK